MPSVDDLRANLDATRAELIEALEGLPAGKLDEPVDGGGTLADLLWELGRDEDWCRRAIQATFEDRAVPPVDGRARPAYLVSTELLVEWLSQSRRAFRTVLRMVGETVAARAVILTDGSESTVAGLLERIAARDREVADRLLAGESTGGPAS